MISIKSLCYESVNIGEKMNIKYFNETDTLLIILNKNEVFETKDLNENVLYETDRNNQLVSITIEHAKKFTQVDSFSFQKVINKELAIAA